MMYYHRHSISFTNDRFKVHDECETAHAYIIMVALAVPAGEVVKFNIVKF